MGVSKPGEPSVEAGRSLSFTLGRGSPHRSLYSNSQPPASAYQNEYLHRHSPPLLQRTRFASHPPASAVYEGQLYVCSGKIVVIWMLGSSATGFGHILVACWELNCQRGVILYGNNSHQGWIQELSRDACLTKTYIHMYIYICIYIYVYTYQNIHINNIYIYIATINR